MGFLDNTSTTVDAILTKKGRELLAKGDGQFKITRFRLSDDEIDYSLYDTTHPNGSNFFGAVIENISLLEAFPVGKLKYFLINASEGTTAAGIINFSTSTIKCSNIIWIKYDPAKESSIERLELKNILPLIVNESFFPTNLKSVKGFMNWFVKCKCFKIIYNNDESLIDFFEEINGFASS